MTYKVWLLWILLATIPLVTAAQQVNLDKPLNNTQKLGQRIFQQRCGVCHSRPSPLFPMYGPALYKDLVEGNEDAMRELISEGTNRMPGFKFGLQPSQIDAIVEYLKTVAKPPKPATPSEGTAGPLD